MPPTRPRPGLRLPAGPTLVVGTGLVLAGAAATWTTSGTVGRSSFALVRVARRLGVLDGVAATLAPAWALLPVAVGLVWLAVAAGRRVTAAVVAVPVCLAPCVVVAGLRSPGLAPGPGVALTLAGSVVGLLGVVLVVAPRLRTFGRRRERAWNRLS